MKQIMIVAALAFAAAGNAQKVNNQLHFEKGQKLEMDVTVNSTMTSAMGEAKVNAFITRSFDVEEVKNGTASIEHKVKHIKVDLESAMGSQKFDSENEADMKSDAGKKVEKSLKNKYTMTVDGTGKVTAVKKDDDNPNEAKGDAGPDMMTNLLAQVIDGIKLPEPGDKTEFSILPEREVSKGDTWTDTTGGKTAVYTVVDITDNDIILSFNETQNVHATQEANGMEIAINSVDKTTGRIRIDRKSGLMKEKSANTDSDGTMEAMGQSLPITKKIERSWIVK